MTRQGNKWEALAAKQKCDCGYQEHYQGVQGISCWTVLCPIIALAECCKSCVFYTWCL